MIVIEDKSKCCGCENCVNICNFNAISMIKKGGFYYPEIDYEKCINCGKCEIVCPIYSMKLLNNSIIDVFAYKAKSGKRQLTSQSGGAFASIATEIIKAGGVVYGVALEENLTPVYTRIAKKEELSRISGSKYVEAEVGNIKEKICTDLSNGNLCLCSGTPCFIDTLKMYLKAKNISTEKLLLVDILCHGVPSRDLYKEYIGYIEKYAGKIVSIKFRDKKIDGWGGKYSTFILKRGVKLCTNSYMNIYGSDNFMRPSCYACKYTKRERVSDITIGDYWNVDKNIMDSKGVSCIIVNTRKGEKFIKNISNYGKLILTNKDLFNQRTLEKPINIPQDKSFYNIYEIEGINGLLDKVNSKNINIVYGMLITKDLQFIKIYFLSKLKRNVIAIKFKNFIYFIRDRSRRNDKK